MTRRSRCIAAGVGSAAVVALLAGSACRHRSARTNELNVVNDSIEGTVKVVGLDAMPQVVLATDDGRAVPLEGDGPLAKVSGLRVLARGKRSTRGFIVTDFRVTAAQGVPATDGVLTLQDANLFLLTTDGRRLALREPVTGLRALVGRRVWIAGPLDRAAVSYGVIEE